MSIPAELYHVAEYLPIEDVLLPMLRPRLHGVPVYSLVPDVDDPFPFVLVRRDHSLQHWRGDSRGFVDQAYVQVDTLTQDPDGDEQGAILSEAVRVAMRDLVRESVTLPSGVSLAEARLLTAPRRVSDWATATGPVQYADLPTGAWRYESSYYVRLRYHR